MKDYEEIGLAIIGGTGYGAGELLRLCTFHPKLLVVSVVSSSNAGNKISKLHPQLFGFYDQKFDSELNLKKLLEFKNRVVVFALPHSVSAQAVKKFIPIAIENNIKILDLSGDCRLENYEFRKNFYGDTFSNEEISQFVYGLPEINSKKIQSAQFVSNPGCLATASALAVLPLVSRFSEKTRIVFDVKTGTSGAGRAVQDEFHHPKRHANSNAYKVLSHRHEPEVLQALGDSKGDKISLSFVPHLLPCSRGILATAHLELTESTEDNLLDLYREYYKDSPFIRVKSEAPELHFVVGSNFCDISVFKRGSSVVAFAALDNLIKGMVGQAMENVNLMFGRNQKDGLWFPSLGLI